MTESLNESAPKKPKRRKRPTKKEREEAYRKAFLRANPRYAAPLLHVLYTPEIAQQKISELVAAGNKRMNSRRGKPKDRP